MMCVTIMMGDQSINAQRVFLTQLWAAAFRRCVQRQVPSDDNEHAQAYSALHSTGFQREQTQTECPR